MSGPALSPEALEARRRAAEDLRFYEEATADERRAEQRAARTESVRVALQPLNSRILHSRPSVQKRRAAAKRAKASRKTNRGR